MTQPEQTPKPCPFCGSEFSPVQRALTRKWIHEKSNDCVLGWQVIHPYQLRFWNRRHFEVTEEMVDAVAKEIGERVFYVDPPSEVVLAEQKEWSQGTCKQSATAVLAAVKRIVEGEA